MDVFIVSIPDESERKSNMLIRNGFLEIFLFELQSSNDDLFSTYVRSENRFGYKRPGVKTSVKNNILTVKLGQDLENTFPDKKTVDL